jgi:hypothetical protein
MNTELKMIFANVNDWLKFAEAKHAGLVILNTAVVIGLLTCYSSVCIFLFKPIFLIGLLCIGLSILLSAISQFPVTENIFFNRKAINNPNLLFFGHLANLDASDFVIELKAIDTTYAPTKFDLDLINQILINSRIAQTKFTIFKIAVSLSIFGSGIIVFTSLIKTVWHI